MKELPKITILDFRHNFHAEIFDCTTGHGPVDW